MRSGNSSTRSPLLVTVACLFGNVADAARQLLFACPVSCFLCGDTEFCYMYLWNFPDHRLACSSSSKQCANNWNQNLQTSTPARGRFHSSAKMWECRLGEI
uniref:Putative secreted protein n=1 Tax=Amblyomma triste TaxID=251400 RepID=A0A023G409_AMBTT